MIKNIFYIFLASALIFSCKKEETTPTPLPTPPTQGPAAEKLFISAKVDGATWKVEELKDDYFFAASWSGSENVTEMDVDYKGSFFLDDFDGPVPTPAAGIMEVGMSNYHYNISEYSGSDDLFNNSFTVGSKNYYIEGDVGTGAEIYFQDATDNFWSSRYGDQTGSTYKITSITNTTYNGPKGKLLEGTLSCKVYAIGDPSQFKTITNGKFKIIFNKYKY